MRRHFRWDKKYLYWGVTAFCVIACAILFYMVLRYLPTLGGALVRLVKILSPFIWGLVIAYLLTPLVRSLEKNVFGGLGKKKNSRSKLARTLSVVIAELVLLAIIVALIYLILPQLYSSIETMVSNSSTYANNLSSWATKVFQDYPQIESYASQVLGEINSELSGWIKNTLLPGLGNVITNVTAGVYYVVHGIYNLLIGIIVSVYVLSNSEVVGAAAKRILYSIFSVEAAQKILEGLDFTDRTFMGFINGKLLDSAIIGLICYIVCAILNMPYALLVSVIVGVTNVVPFFGPFIGAVPSVIIILMVSPVKALIFVIFIIVLQQVDGNIIGPKILGSSIGINGFWVMFSIIVGAGLFGFWGMLLGVPVFVVIYTGISKSIERKLKRSDLPWETAAYQDLDHIDPATRVPVKKLQDEEDAPVPEAPGDAGPQE